MRFFVLGKAITHAADCVMTKEMETAKPHNKQSKVRWLTMLMDSLFHFPKHKIDEYRRIAEKSGEV